MAKNTQPLRLRRAVRRIQRHSRYKEAGSPRRPSEGRTRTGASSPEKMEAQAHWENIYTKKAPDQVSWYRPHLETSVAIVEQVAPGC
jgi:hypothetical protein